jgi:TPR repeat protein
VAAGDRIRCGRSTWRGRRAYLEKSAAQDISYAQFALANLIMDQEPQRARTLLQAAAAAGNQLAAKRLTQIAG